MNAPPPPHCVGPESAEAGLAPGCAGCPNAALCASGAMRLPDPDLEQIHACLRKIKHPLLVMSGKGGVGKSSLSKEIAFALADRGFQVGLLDTDLCGPSLPRLSGGWLNSSHRSNTGIEPVWVEKGVRLMSSHCLLSPEEKNSALTLDGQAKSGWVKLFFKDVSWRELDFLVIDTPPGTSDEHLTLAHCLGKREGEEGKGGAHGVVMVTTPQRVAEADVRRGLTFCSKAKLPVLGLVENMSGFVCPHCSTASSIFPASGPVSTTAGERLSKEFDIPLLGRIPLDPLLMESCEKGKSLIDFLLTLVEENEEGVVSAGNASAGTVEAIFQIVDRIVEMVGAVPPREEEEEEAS